MLQFLVLTPCFAKGGEQFDDHLLEEGRITGQRRRGIGRVSKVMGRASSLMHFRRMRFLYYSMILWKTRRPAGDSHRGSGDGSVIAFAAFHAREVDPFEEHDEVRGADLDAG
ncbi:hypothetical protein V5E97_33610 [Singulisphaera sp. Ch08]|uniref:Uncharacterized protein n=1 Tax=Singulisphaera sp. Ch08 TaxID=3120278 RepID=A0AAU7CDJ7_9BACT